jgi:ABC-type uncharacterized transport system substrate-binding protein
MVQQRVQGVVVGTDAYLITRQQQIISLAKLHALPVMYSWGSPIRSGGLMVYVLADQLYRRAGEFAGRLLKGANVPDLPVEMPIRSGHQSENSQGARPHWRFARPALRVIDQTRRQ